MYTFIGRDSWRLPHTFSDLPYHDDTKVLVNRSLLFFYAEQKITIGDLKKHFTDSAIMSFVKYEFIKIL